MSEEDRQRLIATALARETIVAEIDKKVVKYDAIPGTHDHITFSADGQRVAMYLDYDDAIVVWDVAGGQAILPIGDSEYRGLAFPSISPDGQKLAMTWLERRGASLIWDIASNEVLHVLEGYHGDHVDSLVWSPDGRVLATLGNGNMALWNVDDGSLMVGSEPRQLVDRIAFSPDGRTLAFLDDRDETIHLLRTSDASVIRELQAFDRSSLCGRLMFDPTGNFLGAAFYEGMVVWDASNGEELAVIPEPNDNPNFCSNMAFSPDGRFVAGRGSESGFVVLWSVATDELVNRLNVLGSTRVNALPLDSAFTPSGDVLMVAYTFGRIVFWSIPDGQKLAEINVEGGFEQWKLSSDGKYLVTAWPLRAYPVSELLDSMKR